MLQNAYFFAKIGADTLENERNLPKICQKLATTLRVHKRKLDAMERRFDEAVEDRIARLLAALEETQAELREVARLQG